MSSKTFVFQIWKPLFINKMTNLCIWLILWENWFAETSEFPLKSKRFPANLIPKHNRIQFLGIKEVKLDFSIVIQLLLKCLCYTYDFFSFFSSSDVKLLLLFAFSLSVCGHTFENLRLVFCVCTCFLFFLVWLWSCNVAATL